MTVYERSLCKFSFFILINSLKWPQWLRLWSVSLFDDFNHVKYWCTDIWSIFGWWNLVFDLRNLPYKFLHGIRVVLRVASIVDLNLKPVWLHATIVFQIYYFLPLSGWDNYSVVLGASGTMRNAFRFIRKGFWFPMLCHFGSWGINHFFGVLFNYPYVYFSL